MKQEFIEAMEDWREIDLPMLRTKFAQEDATACIRALTELQRLGQEHDAA